MRKQIVEPPRIIPAHNLFADHGPRCPHCSGLGHVLNMPYFGGITRSTSRCSCKGTGIDLEFLQEQERRSMIDRIVALEQRLATYEVERNRGLVARNDRLKKIRNSRQFWQEMIAWATSDGTAVANSVTETIIFPNITIPANYMQDGRALRLTASGRFSTTATPTIRLRLRWGGVGGTVIWDSGTITTATVTAALFGVRDMVIQTRSNGSAGTLFVIGDTIIGSAAAPSVGSATGAPAYGIFGSAGDDTPAAITCDLTADTALSLTALWSAQSASNTLTGHLYNLESMN